MTKAQALELAEKLDAEIDDCGTTIVLEAPPRMLTGFGTHTYTYDVLRGRAGVWRAIYVDLKAGFELCDIDGCDYCEVE